MRDINAIYELWKSKVKDKNLLDELNKLDEKEIENRFYKDLEFGTGGIRGEIGVGTNLLNIYTIGRITEGVAQYLKSIDGHSIAISYDSRILSKEFSHLTASVFAYHGINVYIVKEMMPTPYLSFMVRHYKCDMGVMITASHNPKQYNGYKVYGNDGCQLTDESANKITKIINGIDCFEVKTMDFDKALKCELINYSDENTKKAYLDEVKNCSVSGDASNIKVTYTALNGTGIQLIPDIMDYLNVEVFYVKEQCKPDGNFPTCPYPNPEKKEANALGLKQAYEDESDLLIATDPDADRIGIAVRYNKEYKLLTGNEVGIILTDFLIRYKKNHGKPIVIKTIVTTPLVDKICKANNVEIRNVYTGFKYIGEQIADLEKNNELNRYLLGFEESYGYLVGTYVRDKDSISAAMIICEAASIYKKQNKNLYDVLMELYKKYGYVSNNTFSYKFDGYDGNERMRQIFFTIRQNQPVKFGSCNVESVIDYLNDDTGLRKSNVIQYNLENDNMIILRPSGTEPLIKVYITTFGEEHERLTNSIKKDLDTILK